MAEPLKVLFVCTSNSCRSQMAEGFARSFGGRIVEPYSAGAKPGVLHPLTVAVMGERGVDVSGQYSKGLADVPQEMALVVTVCDEAAEECPVFPGARRVLHWSVPDPAKAEGTPDQVQQAFRQARYEIERRVRTLLRELTPEHS